MFDLFEEIEQAIKDILMGFVESNLTTMFTDVNEKTATIATEVGQTPQGWNSGIFNMVQNLSESVVIPIAGLIITFVLCYELITMITEKNNMHDIDTWMFFKWVFKAMVAVYLVTNTFDIVMAVFDVGQHLVTSAAGVIGRDTNIDVASTLFQMRNCSTSLERFIIVIVSFEVSPNPFVISRSNSKLFRGFLWLFKRVCIRIAALYNVLNSVVSK